MKFLTKFLFLAILLCGAMGFAWLALTDAPVHPQEMVKTIPADRFDD